MLIGLTGKARSGKDSIGKVLFMDQGFMRLAIADPLKETAACLYGLNPDDFHNDATKDLVDVKWGITRRKMLQDLGQMVKVNMGQDFWIKHWFFKYALVGEHHSVVVTDIRFDIEAEKIHQLGGTIIDVRRPGEGLSGTDASHESERGISEHLVDYYINNNGTLADLKHKVLDILTLMREA